MDDSRQLTYQEDVVTIGGVSKVEQISPKEARFRLADLTLTVKGDGLNLLSLNQERGSVVLQATFVQSFTYHKAGGIKGLFK